MFVFKVENTLGNILTLTQNESNYQVIKIDGLNPSNAQINQSTVAGMDGSKFNSSKLNARAITITLKIYGDVEKNRINLYSYFNTKKWCKLYYKNDTRNVYIEGYTEVHEVDLFSDNEISQITVICPNPYFKAIDEIVDDVSKVFSSFEFPFSFGSNGGINYGVTNTDLAIPLSEINTTKITNVINNSETDTGVIVTVNFSSTVHKLLLRNTDNGETITLNYEFIEDDTLIIDTNKGNKSIKLYRDANEINIFPALTKNSTFFQLAIGNNHFSFLADDGESDNSVNISFKHYTIYGGV